MGSSPGYMFANEAWKANDGSHGPYQFILELPGAATIQQISLGVGTNEESQAAPDQTVHVAISSESATAGYADIGTYQLSGADMKAFPLSPPAHGRWIKLTIDGNVQGTQLQPLQITGTFDPRPAPSVAGVWLYYAAGTNPNPLIPGEEAGSFPTPPPKIVTAELEQRLLDIHQSGGQLTAALCLHDAIGAVLGDQAGPVVNLNGADGPFGVATENAEGTMIAGDGGWFALRVRNAPSCDSIFVARQPQGHGTPVLLLYDAMNYDAGPDRYDPYNPHATLAPGIVTPYPGYRLVPQTVAQFQPQMLGGYQTVVLSSICNANAVLTKTQTRALTDFVYGGGKMIIHDADVCTNTDYSFLPYSFATSNPGRHGAGGAKLILVESDALGSDVTDKAHYVDLRKYVDTARQQLGDANTVITQDSHWCGHLFGANLLGQSGFFQMYAPFGEGLIIYDGLDDDDAYIPEYDRLAFFELKLPANAALPCDARVASSFTIAQTGGPDTFKPGTSQTVTFPISVFANGVFAGTVGLTVHAAPDIAWPASLSHDQVALNGDSAQSDLMLSIPADAKPGAYSFDVTGTDAAGQTSSATVTIESAGAVPTPAPTRRAAPRLPTPKIAKALATAKRVAVYGIYFDFASATLKPESAPVLLEIADALKANPSWKLTIEGHTDNVGGAGYNLDLSRRRAESVKSALVSGYHIEASRLSTVGYGFSRPVAGNDTPQGRARNRRVELVRH
jgi:outer membrane protein OmpA-like peptidoglycan-associated protein